VDQTPVLDAALAEHVPVAELGPRLHWEDRGWPAWSMYAPVAAAAIAGRVPIRAANAPLDQVKKLAHEGDAAVDPELAGRLAKVPLGPPEEAALEQEMKDAHCGHLPDRVLPRMALAQRARDASMAAVLVRALEAGGPTRPQAALVCGAGHARTDRGVPRHVRAARADAKIVSVAFLEVIDGKTDPAALLGEADAPAFDFVWFTPRASDDDPCAAFRKPPSAR
jgi:uncharacterized iron-regulated protein